MASSRTDRALSAQIRRSAGWVALAQSKLAAWAVGAQARKPARAASGMGTRMGVSQLCEDRVEIIARACQRGEGWRFQASNTKEFMYCYFIVTNIHWIIW